MTIDEAIKHAIQVTDSYKDTVPDCDCARDHRQLADWLTELKRLKDEKVDLNRQLRHADEIIGRQSKRLVKLEAENAMLSERLLESREANEYLYTELRRYKSIFRMKPRAMNVLFDENSKLRELARELWEGYMDPPCEDCPLKGKPACADCPICAREAAVIDHMRELGIEVEDG